MQLVAKLLQKFPLQSSSGKNGEWKKQDIIVEPEGQFSKKVCVTIWGDKINLEQFHVGNTLQIDFDIESREFNCKWYTNIKAYKIGSISNTAQKISEHSGEGENDFFKESPDVLLF